MSSMASETCSAGSSSSVVALELELITDTTQWETFSLYGHRYSARDLFPVLVIESIAVSM